MINLKRIFKWVWIIIAIFLLLFTCIWLFLYYQFFPWKITQKFNYEENKKDLIEIEKILKDTKDQYIRYEKNSNHEIMQYLISTNIIMIENTPDYIIWYQDWFLENDYWIIKIKTIKWRTIINEWSKRQINGCIFHLWEELWDSWYKFICS